MKKAQKFGKAASAKTAQKKQSGVLKYVQKPKPPLPIQSSLLLSNKGEITVDASFESYALTDKDAAYISRPFIDRIVLVASLKQSDITQTAPESVATLVDLLGHARSRIKSKGYHHPKKIVRNYVSGQKQLGPNKATVLWSISREGGAAAKVRLEFNPSNIGGFKGLDAIRAEWDDNFKGAIDIDLWLKRASITELHVTVDVVNVPFIDLLFEFDDPYKWSYWLSPAKKVQTVTKWSFAQQKNQAELVMYDKKRQLQEAEESPWEEEQKQPLYDIVPHVRIEHRYAGKRSLRHIDRLANPFTGVSIRHIPSVAKYKPPVWRLFAYAAQVVGINAALSWTPTEHKKEWAHALEKMPEALFWQPEKNWKRWRDSLKTSGFRYWIDIAQSNEWKL